MKVNRPWWSVGAVFAAMAGLLLLNGCSGPEIRASDALAIFRTVAFSRDGRSIAAGQHIHNVVFLYDAATLQRKMVFMGKQLDYASLSYFPRSLAFSPDGAWIAAPGIDDSFVIWDTATGEEAFRIPELRGARAAAFSPSGDLLATAGPGNDVILWNLAEAKQHATLRGHSATATAVAFSADGKLLASGSADKTVRLWAVAGQREVAVLTGHPYSVHSLSFSADAGLLAAYAGDLRVWELASGRALAPLLDKVDTSTVQGIAMLAYILSGVSSVKVVGAPVMGSPPPGFDPYFRAAADGYPAMFSPDGKRLAVMRFNVGLAGDHEILVLDVNSKATVTSIRCQCFTLAFSPDGKQLVTGGWGLKLWDVDTGKEITLPR